MLRNLLSPQGKAIRKFLVGNRGVREFVAPKLGFLLSCAVLSGLSGNIFLLLLLVGGVVLIEGILAVQEYRRELKEGFTQKRAQKVGIIRLGFAGMFGLVATILFSLLPWWIALTLGMLKLVLSFAAYLYVSLLSLLKDMQGDAPSEDSELFQQVREMRNLPEVVAKLRLRLLQSKSQDERYSLTFYLGWAETYRGHHILQFKNWEQAATYYREALEIDPANLGARASLAVCYARQEEFELAVSEVERAVAVFNGQRFKFYPHYDESLWHWHRNEVSSEYEQSAGVFQLCGLVIALLRVSELSGATKEFLTLEIEKLILQIPGRDKDQLLNLLAKKGGTSPGALGLVAAGPYRAPASPLNLLEEAFCLPLLTLQVVEPAA